MTRYTGRDPHRAGFAESAAAHPEGSHSSTQRCPVTDVANAISVTPSAAIFGTPATEQRRVLFRPAILVTADDVLGSDKRGAGRSPALRLNGVGVTRSLVDTYAGVVSKHLPTTIVAQKRIIEHGPATTSDHCLSDGNRSFHHNICRDSRAAANLSRLTQEAFNGIEQWRPGRPAAPIDSSGGDGRRAESRDGLFRPSLEKGRRLFVGRRPTSVAMAAVELQSVGVALVDVDFIEPTFGIDTPRWPGPELELILWSSQRWHDVHFCRSVATGPGYHTDGRNVINAMVTGGTWRRRQTSRRCPGVWRAGP